MSEFLLPLDVPHLDAAIRDAKSSSPEARWLSALALGTYTGPRVIEAIELLRELVGDDLEEVRAQAFEGLSQQARCGLHVEESLVHSALSDNAERVRCCGIEMASVVLKDPADSVVALLRDEGDTVRAAAASAMGEIGSIEHVDELARALKDSDERVRAEVAIALAKTGDSRGGDELIGLLAAGREYELDAAFCLGKIRYEKAVDDLERIGKRWRTHAELKAACFASLASIGRSGAIESLNELLGARGFRTRHAALAALCRLPQSGAIPRVALLLDSSKEEEVSSAIQTLVGLSEVAKDTVRAELTKRRHSVKDSLRDELEEALVELEETR